MSAYLIPLMWFMIGYTLIIAPIVYVARKLDI